MPAKKQLAVKKQILVPAIVSIVMLSALSYLVYVTFFNLKKVTVQLSEANRKESAILKLQSLKAEEEQLLKAFPNIQKKSEIIEEVVGLARKEGIEINQIDPLENTLPGTKFRQLKLILTGKGTYLPTTRFLKRLETSPYFVLATQLQLSGYNFQIRNRSRYTSARGQGEDAMDQLFKVTVNIFFLE